MESTISGSEQYLDFGASYHMIGNKEFFNSLEEKELQLPIELGDNGRYSTKWIGMVIFNRESFFHPHLKDVMYVPGLKKNLVYVAILEDHGYDVFLSKGKANLKHVSTGPIKKFGV